MTKTRFNKGERSNLFYFRDRTGNEIDLIIDKGDHLSPIEIKSSESLNDSFFKNLIYWENLTSQKGGALLYAGERTGFKKGNFVVKNWKDVGKL